MCRHRDTMFEIQCTHCQEFYDCRHCHFTTVSDHTLNIRSAITIKCKTCKSIGPVAAACSTCQQVGGGYICLPCRRFDGKEKTIAHCHVCNVCDDVTLHKCFPLDDCCSICLLPFLDRLSLHVTSCGHVFHSDCYLQMFNKDGSTCPLCRKRLRADIPCDVCGENIAAKGSSVLLMRLSCKHTFHVQCFPETNLRKTPTEYAFDCPCCHVVDVRKLSFSVDVNHPPP